MQHVKDGDLISIEEDGKFYYFLILSRSAFFGCQWCYAFHLTSEKLETEESILSTFGEGLHMLVDFIDERRENRVIKVSKKIDTSNYQNKQNLKAKIKEPNGTFRWYIYSQNFNILAIQDELFKDQYSFPIGSGNKFKDAKRIINLKWYLHQVLFRDDQGNFPFTKDDITEPPSDNFFKRFLGKFKK